MTSRGEVTVREMPPEMAPASESTSARRICDGSSSEPIGGGGGGGEKGRDGPRARRGRVVWPKRRFGSWDGGVVVDWWGWPGSTALRLVQVQQQGGGLLRRDFETGLLLRLSKRNVLIVFDPPLL